MPSATRKMKAKVGIEASKPVADDEADEQHREPERAEERQDDARDQHQRRHQGPQQDREDHPDHQSAIGAISRSLSIA